MFYFPATLPQFLHVRHYFLDPLLVGGSTQQPLTIGHQTATGTKSQVRSCEFVIGTVARTHRPLWGLTWWHWCCSPYRPPAGGSPRPRVSTLVVVLRPTSSSRPVPLPASLEDGGDHRQVCDVTLKINVCGRGAALNPRHKKYELRLWGFWNI